MAEQAMIEAYAWESTTVCYTRWITDSRYRKLRPNYQRWYRPICPKCGPTLTKGDTDNSDRSHL